MKPDTRPRITCTACSGAGNIVGPCKTCAGTGHVAGITGWYACPDCDNRRCRRCGGSGQEIAP